MKNKKCMISVSEEHHKRLKTFCEKNKLSIKSVIETFIEELK